MIRKEWIGVKVWIKRTNTNIVIEDDPKKYDYYKSLGLDIFVKEEKKNDSNKSESSKYNRGNARRKNKPNKS